MPDSLAGSTPDRHPPSSGSRRGLVGVVLAAGEGARLRPLTFERPKALCPVGGVPLVDGALARLAPVVEALAVNVHHGRAQLEGHLALRHPRVHRSIEEPVALGTAGALAQLCDWIDGRPALVVNADGWSTVDLAPLLDGWDGVRPRVLVAGQATFSAGMQVVASLVPFSVVARLEVAPTGLYECCWLPAHEAGALDVISGAGSFVDCGTVTDYLRANLAATRSAGGSIIDPSAVVTGSVHDSVVGAGAVVAGRVVRCVLWDGALVHPAEDLTDAVRTSAGRTVLVR